MKERIARLATLLRTAPRKKLLALAGLIAVTLALPLAVFVSQQQQNLKQQAASPDSKGPSVISCPSGRDPNQKLPTDTLCPSYWCVGTTYFGGTPNCTSGVDKVFSGGNYCYYPNVREVNSPKCGGTGGTVKACTSVGGHCTVSSKCAASQSTINVAGTTDCTASGTVCCPDGDIIIGNPPAATAKPTPRPSAKPTSAPTSSPVPAPGSCRMSTGAIIPNGGSFCDGHSYTGTNTCNPGAGVRTCSNGTFLPATPCTTTCMYKSSTLAQCVPNNQCASVGGKPTPPGTTPTPTPAPLPSGSIGVTANIFYDDNFNGQKDGSEKSAGGEASLVVAPNSGASQTVPAISGVAKWTMTSSSNQTVNYRIQPPKGYTFSPAGNNPSGSQILTSASPSNSLSLNIGLVATPTSLQLGDGPNTVKIKVLWNNAPVPLFAFVLSGNYFLTGPDGVVTLTGIPDTQIGLTQVNPSGSTLATGFTSMSINGKSAGSNIIFTKYVLGPSPSPTNPSNVTYFDDTSKAAFWNGQGGQLGTDPRLFVDTSKSKTLDLVFNLNSSIVPPTRFCDPKSGSISQTSGCGQADQWAPFNYPGGGGICQPWWGNGLWSSCSGLGKPLGVTAWQGTNQGGGGGGGTGGGGSCGPAKILECALKLQACVNGQCSGGPNPGPSATPGPTTSPRGDTKLAITVGLDGVGVAGDHQNPGSGGNPNPKHQSRDIAVQVYDTNNNLVDTVNVPNGLTYTPSSGLFNGTVALKQGFATGSYRVFVKTPAYLRKNLGGIVTITAGATNQMPPTSTVSALTAGDIVTDNAINILDYNVFLSCSIFSKDSGAACNQDPHYRVNADLNDNGIIDQDDYNILLREWVVQNGD